MEKTKPILFFDGHCNLCNTFIDLVVRKDKTCKVLVSSLQGQTASQQLPKEVREGLKSVVFLDHGALYFKSSAIFRLALHLGGLFYLILPFWVLPRFFTNWVYDFVALTRYKIFGRRDSCRLPTPEETRHFLP